MPVAKVIVERLKDPDQDDLKTAIHKIFNDLDVSIHGKHILLRARYGFRNIGDKAILSGLLQIIRRNSSKSKITVVSGGPTETALMHNVNSYSP